MTNGRPIASRLVPPGTPAWGSRWKQANADWYAHSFAITAHGSWYPHRENYLDLDPTYRDAYGQPLVRMTMDIRENELRMSEYCTQRAEEIAKETGATSVVSPHLQHWDAQNLFVVGASVYTFNAGYNPTGPLAALALRLGDDVRRY